MSSKTPYISYQTTTIINSPTAAISVPTAHPIAKVNIYYPLNDQRNILPYNLLHLQPMIQQTLYTT